MYKATTHSHGGYKHDFEYNVKVSIHDNIFGVKDSDSDLSIFIYGEPSVVTNYNEILKKNFSNYDYILTFDEEILNSVPNAILFEFGTTWVKPSDVNMDKSNSISFVCGYKNFAPGHILRQLLWNNQNVINNKSLVKEFYTSQHGGVQAFEDSKMLADSKLPLFDSKFHISIENVKQKYYFSEKLIDPLLMKTIPIYYGCSNFENYFNPKGAYLVNSLKDIIEVCNTITESDYLSKLEFVEENYELAKKFIDWPSRLDNKIKELINYGK